MNDDLRQNRLKYKGRKQYLKALSYTFKKCTSTKYETAKKYEISIKNIIIVHLH